ncbi:MAG: hypothetical protein CL935_05125 [Deltaproteobacteria bacterium]|nr:hypothetical protein [Deltaproteobacteria bacterium]
MFGNKLYGSKQFGRARKKIFKSENQLKKAWFLMHRNTLKCHSPNKRLTLSLSYLRSLVSDKHAKNQTVHLDSPEISSRDLISLELNSKTFI